MELADKVRTRREELGMSQEDLAFKMGYKSRSSINKIETGREVSQKIIVRLAEALNVPVRYLMSWDDVEDGKEKPTTPEDDGLTESQRKLIAFAKTVPEDKAAMILQVMQTIVGDG